MGLRRAYVEFIQRSVDATLGGLDGLKMLELGNQRLRRRDGFSERTGKAYYEKRGVEHVSLDFNGEDGAVALDLSVPIDKPEWDGYFDIITNSGTTEHVEPYAAQYTCFANLHRWVRPGGIMVHIVPAVEGLATTRRWHGHCNNYYSADFFTMLARENDYELVASEVVNHLRAACVRKRGDGPFMADSGTFLAQVTRKEGGKSYAPGRRSLWARLFGR